MIGREDQGCDGSIVECDLTRFATAQGNCEYVFLARHWPGTPKCQFFRIGGEYGFAVASLVCRRLRDDAKLAGFEQEHHNCGSECFSLCRCEPASIRRPIETRTIAHGLLDLEPLA